MNVAGCAEVHRKSTTNNLVGAAVALTVIAVTAMLYLFDPMQHRFYPVCPFHALTGLHCPGCGALRALHALTHGHVVAALRYNPLAMLLLPVVIFLLARRETVTIRPIWIWVLVGVVIAFGVARNIPQYPFTLLAP